MSRVNITCLLVAVLLLPWAVPAASAATPSSHEWRLLSEAAIFPPTFGLPMGVYDPVRHRVLVIDASDGPGQLPVWTFTSSPSPSWVPLSAVGEAPGRLYLASAVYDPVRDRLLVFGSVALGSEFPSDIQVWALSLAGTPSWERLSANKPAPARRWGQSAVYDPVDDRVIMFGGMQLAPVAYSYTAETWSYSLTTGDWSLLAESPPALIGREGHGAMYDPVNQRMLVFGGHCEAGSRHFLDDLWELRLGASPVWSELEVAGPRPGARSAFGTVYDPVRQRMLVHGGVLANSGVEPDEIWQLSLAGDPAWERITTQDTLRGRSYPVDVYDPVNDRFLACGGGGYALISSLSLAAPGRWGSVLPTRPTRTPGERDRHAVVHDTRRDRFIALGGAYASVDSALWSYAPDDGEPWSGTSASYVPLFTNFFDHSESVVYDSLTDRIIVCDWSQAAWRPAAGPGEWTPFGPPVPYEAFPFRTPGFGCGVTLDTRRHRLLITGGMLPAGHVQWASSHGVWSLSLAEPPEWKFVGNMPQDCGAAAHAAFYDEVRDRLVLVGGVWSCGRFAAIRPYGPLVWSTPLSDTLEWTTWESTQADPPPAPPESHAAYDVRSDMLYLCKGQRLWSRPASQSVPWVESALLAPAPTVESAIVFDAARSQLLALFASSPGLHGVQAWALATGPLTVSLVDSRRTPGAVELSWRSTTAVGKPATLERREAPGDWLPLAALAFDVRGLANFSDESVQPGHDYAYRVRVADGDSSYVSAATLVAPPEALRFAMLGARPNPAVQRFQLAFSLPDAAPARLELFDLRGRRCASREVGALGAGRHTITLGEANALVPGVYFARLQRGGASQVQRVVLTR